MIEIGSYSESPFHPFDAPHDVPEKLKGTSPPKWVPIKEKLNSNSLPSFQPTILNLGEIRTKSEAIWNVRAEILSKLEKVVHNE